ncbi:tetratricopeptide repeat protein [Oscillatoria laete-virens NRMC-F 0139]|nr:tetratricopeptide repeat protein [Oscillatoria laete-virens]MDL5052144.1 tetratricopeptide repeat protein [Oscillatoria laete-virens NRMC-F 0139]
MGKLVVLKLDGDIQARGFRVTLEIGPDRTRPDIEVAGGLPASPELCQNLSQWQTTYRSLGQITRITPHRISIDGSPHHKVRECHQLANRLQSSLSQWLASENFSAIDRRLREELQRTEAIRVLLRTDNPDLQKLPWHLWDFFERYPLAEMALSSEEFERMPVYSPPLTKNKVRILAILGHAQGIDVESDRRLLENLPHAEVVFLVEPEPEAINDRLWEQAWDIIFFAGHSETDGDTGRIYINPQASLTINELWYGLRKAVERGLQLAIFNSCDGLGLARQLNDLNIPQMIVMRELVPDRVAQAFMTHFLTRFSEGEPFYLAVREARERLQGLEKQYPCATWLPAIYQHPATALPTWAEMAQITPELPIFSNASCPIFSQCAEQTLPSSPTPATRPGLSNKAKIALLLAVGAIAWQFAIPLTVKSLNNLGLSRFFNGELSSADKIFRLAHRLKPDNSSVLYNQGWHCETIRDFGCAYSHYQQSAKFGSVAAYSNLGRLYIKGYMGRVDYQVAVGFIKRGLELYPKQISSGEIHIYYSLIKNLGWARLGQERYEDALEHLEEAIALDPTRPAAYCLLAQVQEAQGQIVEAIATWETCLEYAHPDRPDEDEWIGMARQRVKVLTALNSDPL